MTCQVFYDEENKVYCYGFKQPYFDVICINLTTAGDGVACCTCLDDIGYNLLSLVGLCLHLVGGWVVDRSMAKYAARQLVTRYFVVLPSC